MERCDAIVVGGGPGGSTVARALRMAGLDVVLFDKQSFPRDKVCAGWVTPPVWQALQLAPAEYAAAGNILQPIAGFRSGLLGGRQLDIEYGQVVSYAIRRIEFDHYLLQRSGARQCLGEGVESIERAGAVWRVNGVLEAPLLIGAGGHTCPVARLLGAQFGSGPGVVAAQEIEFELSDEEAARSPIGATRPELYFCPELDGYGWVVRKGRYLNVGLGREGGRGVAQQVAQFRDLLVTQGRLPATTPQRFKGHAYGLSLQPAPRTVVGEGVLLVGDAAGLASPQSGEGIRPAVESALLAAQLVQEVAGDFRRERLAPYAARLEQHFGPRQAAPSRLPAVVTRPLARWLLTNRTFTRRVVLDRWFLHR